jgi:hypothetical protein
MNERDAVQTAVLVAMFVLALVGYRRLRDAGAESVSDEREPSPSAKDDDSARAPGDAGDRRRS